MLEREIMQKRIRRLDDIVKSIYGEDLSTKRMKELENTSIRTINDLGYYLIETHQLGKVVRQREKYLQSFFINP
ncbi:hypothetical protein H0A61_02152 [Koleobacter methoxysyntrophicus]|uniref:Uncharacterized protein n=1 Tax=Koleobacter methoxysyntrophicus TaxID=2751313 RepID=A0A8A0RMY9_9FIRM|nr:hypothetical protein [Koleobacter methoxysyntrophicus]QSQ09771.1 hypothetical protein H0A61_02152 [Koleobacter methoxysyntrophicus]